MPWMACSGSRRTGISHVVPHDHRARVSTIKFPTEPRRSLKVQWPYQRELVAMPRDAELTALLQAAGGPFPSGLGGEEINGVDLVLLDEAIHGTASHYERNGRPLSDEHRAWLVDALQDWDQMWPDLPTDESREYFGRARAVALYLLERRSAR